jgi:tetratricopeptide (TPR) repeat protein
MKKLIAAVVLLASLQSNACLNLFSVDSAGKPHVLNHGFHIATSHDNNHISRNIISLEKSFAKGDYDFKRISDYGSYLLMGGRFKDGLDIFRALIVKHNGVYEIAANIAVAYELNGNIDSALYWERKALDINPNGHYGSEWIHLKILEAKQQLATDSNWCLHNNVAGITAKMKARPNTAHRDGADIQLDNFFRDFIVQLSERIPFTYGTDPALGKLLYELGEAYLSVSMHRAYFCYAAAKYFYPALETTATARMQLIKKTYPSPEKMKRIKPAVSTSTINEINAPTNTELATFMKRLTTREGFANPVSIKMSIPELLTKI